MTSEFFMFSVAPLVLSLLFRVLIDKTIKNDNINFFVSVLAIMASYGFVSILIHCTHS